MRLLLIIMITSFIPNISKGEESKVLQDSLSSCINKKEWFELRKLMDKIDKKDIATSMWELATFLVKNNFNKIEEANLGAKQLLEKSIRDSNSIGTPYTWTMFLQNNALYMQDSHTYKWACEELLKLSDISDEFYKEQESSRKIAQNMCKHPSLRVKQVNCDTTFNYSYIPNTHLTVIPIKLNGIEITSWLDTGAGMPIMYEEAAKRLGVKRIIGDTLLVNGIKTSRAIVDSVQIGNYYFYNLQVALFPQTRKLPQMIPDSIKYKLNRADSILKSQDLIWGMPCLRFMNEIEFNTKKMTVSFRNKDSYTSDKYSKRIPMGIFDNVPHIKININNKDAILVLDTGMEGDININHTFYEKNKENFIIRKDSTINYLGANIFEYKIPIFIPNDIIMSNKVWPANNTHIYPKEHSVFNYDGMLGNSIFNNYEKIILNFRDMHIILK